MQARFAYPAPGCAGRACLATLRPPCPAASLRGGLRPDGLGSVGAATGLDAPYAHRLPRPALSRWGGSIGRGCAAPAACPAAARRLPDANPREDPRIKSCGYNKGGGEGSKPRGHGNRAKREIWAQRRVFS